MRLRNKAVFITGGTGFVGRNLVSALLEKGVERVRVLTRKDLNALRDEFPDHRLEFVKGDVVNVEHVRTGMGVSDIVFHLAAHADVSGSKKSPRYSFNVTAGGTLNTLKAALDNGAQRFIYLSSARVYGDPIYRPVDEKHPLMTKTVYGGSKLTGEIMTDVFHRTYGLKATILRAFSIYGPWRLPKKHTLSGVIPLFVDKALKNEPLTVVGEGEQTKDFVYIDDVIQGLVLAVKKDVSGEIFNIATGTATSINELANLVLELTKSGSKITHIPSEKESVSNVADITKAETHLGYAPIISLRSGLKKYITWYNEWRRAHG